MLGYESTITYWLGSLVVKHPSSDQVVPGSNPGPVIFKRLVAWGNHQHPGIDYGELFLPIMCLESLCTILALAAIHNLDIIQFDITLGEFTDGDADV